MNMNINSIINMAKEYLKDESGKNVTENDPSIIKLIDSIEEVVASAKDMSEDGKYQFTEIMEVCGDVIQLIGNAEFIKDLSLDKKIKLCTELINEIYFSEDYLDNPDIPYLPNWIEDKIEDYLFDLVLPGIIKSILK